MIRSLSCQSLIDIAIQTSGTMEGVFELAVLNGRSITDVLPADDVLEVGGVINAPVARYYASRGIRPATEIDVTLPMQGIGIWRISRSFRVS
jgi:hypothetical protein